MIAKVTFGKGATGLVRYITQERSPHVIDYITGDHHVLGAVVYRNLAANNARDAAREMRTLSQLSRQVKKPYMHLILSWHPSERPTEDQMIEAMDRLLKQLGLEHNQAVLAIHREKDHLHLHAGINRVGMDGIAWDTWRSKERIMKIVRKIELEMGFRPHAEFAKIAAEKKKIELNAQEQRVLEHSGAAKEVPEDIARAQRMERADRIMERYGKIARGILRSARSWDQALDELEAKSIGIEPYNNPKTPRRKGLMLVDLATGERCAISELGSDYGRAALEKRLGAFPDERPSIGIAEPSIDEARKIADEDGLKKSAPDVEYQAYQPDRSLRDDYDRERRATITKRDHLLREQRRSERERRAELHSQRAERVAALTQRNLAGVLLKAAKSELAFEYAQLREDLEDLSYVEREQIRKENPLPTWLEFVQIQAKLGDDRAIAELWRMKQLRMDEVAFDPFDPIIEQPKEQTPTPPVARKLSELKYDVDGSTGDVTYSWTDDNRDAFTDLGGRVRILHGDQRRDDVRVALQFAREKWGDRLFIVGTDEFRGVVLDVASELGMTILNPELQELQQRIRVDRGGPQATIDIDQPVPRGAAPPATP